MNVVYIFRNSQVSWKIIYGKAFEWLLSLINTLNTNFNLRKVPLFTTNLAEIPFLSPTSFLSLIRHTHSKQKKYPKRDNFKLFVVSCYN